MELYEVIDDKPQYVLSDKYEIEGVYYGGLKIGYIGEIVEEFKNSLNIILVVLKVTGFKDYYKCIAKSSLNKLDNSDVSPFIVWNYLPSEVKADAITINGIVVGLRNSIVSLKYGSQNLEIKSGNELNLVVDTSKGFNKSEIIIKEEGLKQRNYGITIKNVKRLKKQMNTKDIITKLDELEYFKYLTSETQDKFKNLLIEQLESGWLNMPNQYYFHDDQNQFNKEDLPSSIDRRSIDVDGSHIFRGGLQDMLKEFKHIFESRNLQFEIIQNKEDYSGMENEYLKHSVMINDTEYEIFDGVPERGLSEMEYLKSLFNLLNEELKRQNYTEETFTVITSIESLYFMLISTSTKEFIESIGSSIQNKVIDLNSF